MGLLGRSIGYGLCVWLVLGGMGCTRRTLKPINPCLVSAVGAKLEVNNIDKIDLLFVVDDSSSMADEQAALRDQFPRLIRALTSGDRNLDTMPDFRPVTDLHLGVVSTNMGVGGVAVPNIQGTDSCKVGDDGLLLHVGKDASQANCAGANFPSFLSYRGGVDDAATTVSAFSCIASLGIKGCGYEQQLEAPLKALWPSMDALGNKAAPPLGGAFVGTEATSDFGHGDRENAGFMRAGSGASRALLAIVVVTDEEDCSSADPTHFTYVPGPSSDPLYSQPPNLRCYYNKPNLFPVERYVKGFQALHPDPGLVVFAAIAGVPVDLVTAAARANVDFTDAKSRDAHYDRILADSRMAEVIDPTTSGADSNLTPSCTNMPGQPPSKAYPPRRIVEVAKQMGENGLVQSICQADFTPALDAIIQLIASKIDALCLPRPLIRTAEGKVDCDMIWELPAPSPDLPANTPTECGMPGWEFLLPADPRLAADRRGAVCKVAQLAVRGQGAERKYDATPNDGQLYSEGWYYDDFSPRLAAACPKGLQHGIGLSANAAPPSGVTVRLQCLNEVQSLPNRRTDLDPSQSQPAIGDGCAEVVRNGQTLRGDDACAVTLAGGIKDTRMFCHQELNVCVMGCSTTAECPPAWVCDTREDTASSAGGNMCVNPTCGGLN